MPEKLSRSAASRMNPALAGFFISMAITSAEGAAIILLENPAIAVRYTSKLRRLRDSLNVILGDAPAEAARGRRAR